MQGARALRPAHPGCWLDAAPLGALAPTERRRALAGVLERVGLAARVTRVHLAPGERKQVTVMFCDLANSTALAERIGPEAMHTLLNRFFELALDDVHRYEGTIL